MKDRLDVFLAVAERLSFTQAAQALYISQPAVSAAIKALEADYDLPLFSRAGGRAELTEAGQMLLQYAKQIKALEIQASHDLHALKGEVSGRLSVGASTTIAQYILPRLLGDFAASFPHISFALTAQKTGHIAELLRAGKIDIAIVEGPLKGSEFNISPWMPDELLLNVPAHHAWASKVLTFKDIISAPLIMREPGSGTRQVLEEAFRSKQVEFSDLNIVLELGSTEAIKLAIESGLGFSFLSEWSCHKEHLLETIKPATVADFRIPRSFNIVQTKESENNAVVQRFLSFLRKFASRLKPPS